MKFTRLIYSEELTNGWRRELSMSGPHACRDAQSHWTLEPPELKEVEFAYSADPENETNIIVYSSCLVLPNP